MVDVVVASLDVTLDEPLHAFPGLVDPVQRGMATASWPETVREVGELRLVVGVQQATHDLLQQLVRPRRDAEGTHLPVGLRDIRPPHRGPPKAFMTYEVDEVFDLSHGHSVSGLLRHPLRHRPIITIDACVCFQVQRGVEELTIYVLQVQSSLATIPDDIQYDFSLTHHAHLR